MGWKGKERKKKKREKKGKLTKPNTLVQRELSTGQEDKSYVYE